MPGSAEAPISREAWSRVWAHHPDQAFQFSPLKPQRPLLLLQSTILMLLILSSCPTEGTQVKPSIASSTVNSIWTATTGNLSAEDRQSLLMKTYPTRSQYLHADDAPSSQSVHSYCLFSMQRQQARTLLPLGLYSCPNAPNLLTTSIKRVASSSTAICNKWKPSGRPRIKATSLAGTAEQRHGYDINLVDIILLGHSHLNVDGVSSKTDLHNVSFRTVRIEQTGHSTSQEQTQGHTVPEAASIVQLVVPKEYHKNIEVFGPATQTNSRGEQIIPAQGSGGVKHPAIAVVTVKVRGVPLEVAIAIVEAATTKGGLLSDLWVVRQETNDHAPVIMKGAPLIRIDPQPIPKDTEEAFRARIRLQGPLPRDVSIPAAFMQAVREAAVETVRRDTTAATPEATQDATTAATTAAGKVAAALQLQSLTPIRLQHLDVVEIVAVTQAKNAPKGEGEVYDIHTTSSASAAELASIEQLVVVGSYLTFIVKPLKLQHPKAASYMMLYRLPGPGPVLSDEQLLLLKEQLLAMCTAQGKRLMGSYKVTEEKQAEYLMEVPTILGTQGRTLLKDATANDILMALATPKGTPYAVLEPDTISRLLRGGGWVGIRYADKQSMLLGAAALTDASYGFMQQRIKGAVSNISYVGGSPPVWAAAAALPASNLYATAAIEEAKGSKLSPSDLVIKLSGALVMKDPMLLPTLLPLEVKAAAVKLAAKKGMKELLAVPKEEHKLKLEPAEVAASPQETLDDYIAGLAAESDAEDQELSSPELRKLLDAEAANAAAGGRATEVRDAIERAGGNKRTRASDDADEGGAAPMEV